MEAAPSRTHAVRIASYIAAGLGLFLVLYLRLLPALLAGLLVYEVVVSTAPLMGRKLSGDRARVLAVALIGVLVVGLLTLLILGGISFFRNEIGNPEDLWQNKLMPLVERARQQLPPAVVDRLPESVDALRVPRWTGCDRTPSPCNWPARKPRASSCISSSASCSAPS